MDVWDSSVDAEKHEIPRSGTYITVNLKLSVMHGAFSLKFIIQDAVRY